MPDIASRAACVLDFCLSGVCAVIRFSHGEPALPLTKNINNYITTTTITTITTTTTTITTTYYYHYYYYYYSLFIYIQCPVCGSIQLLCLMLVSLCGHCHVKYLRFGLPTS